MASYLGIRIDEAILMLSLVPGSCVLHSIGRHGWRVVRFRSQSRPRDQSAARAVAFRG